MHSYTLPRSLDSTSSCYDELDAILASRACSDPVSILENSGVVSVGQELLGGDNVYLIKSKFSPYCCVDIDDEASLADDPETGRDSANGEVVSVSSKCCCAHIA